MFYVIEEECKCGGKIMVRGLAEFCRRRHKEFVVRHEKCFKRKEYSSHKCILKPEEFEELGKPGGIKWL